jgi:uracil-DNA glycosylase
MTQQPTENPAQRAPNIEPSWLEALGDEFQKPYMVALRAFLVEEMRTHTVFPPGKEMFNAFWLTPFSQVKVVLLGQDPYHGPKQAHGLCFSVRRGIKTPPSLENMYRELEADLSIPPASHGDLTHWAQQGVLLLNTVLSVRAREANSHKNKGWETFTDRVITLLNAKRNNLVFVLWGAAAKQKALMIDRQRHLILQAAHPSPYSAESGFFGCRHFSKINDYLRQTDQAPIQWRLPDEGD